LAVDDALHEIELNDSIAREARTRRTLYRERQAQRLRMVRLPIRRHFVVKYDRLGKRDAVPHNRILSRFRSRPPLLVFQEKERLRRGDVHESHVIQADLSPPARAGGLPGPASMERSE
jgi:hypothetical protein